MRWDVNFTTKAVKQKNKFTEDLQTVLLFLVEDLKKTTRPSRKFFRDLPTTVVPEKDLETLRDVLGLGTVPARIECFDIYMLIDG